MAAIYGSGIYAESLLQCQRSTKDVLTRLSRTRYPLNKYYFSKSSSTVFFMALRPSTGHGLLILEVSRSHTTTHHSR